MMGRRSPYVNGRCPTCLRSKVRVLVDAHRNQVMQWIITKVADELGLERPFRRGCRTDAVNKALNDIADRFTYHYRYGGRALARRRKRRRG